MSRVEQSRRRFEKAWGALSRSLTAEVGWRPGWPTGWMLPILGFTGGLALAGLVRVHNRRGRHRAGRLVSRTARRERGAADPVLPPTGGEDS